jgi:hypothetical protein
MRRSVARQMHHEARQVAQRAAMCPAAQARGAASAENARCAEKVDPVTGTLIQYGQLGITSLGEPFRLSGRKRK